MAARKKVIKKDDDDAIDKSKVAEESSDLSTDTDDDEDEDLTRQFARSKIIGGDETDVDYFSTDEDEEEVIKKIDSSDVTYEDDLDSVIEDYSGVDSLPPTEANTK